MQETNSTLFYWTVSAAERLHDTGTKTTIQSIERDGRQVAILVVRFFLRALRKSTNKVFLSDAMADANKTTIDGAIRLVEAKGLTFQGATIIGTNYMSCANDQRDSRICAVKAYREHKNAEGYGTGVKDWYTFTYQYRARSLRNETKHRDETWAQNHYDYMIDTGDFYHPDNMDVWWKSQEQRLAARLAAARLEQKAHGYPKPPELPSKTTGTA